MEKEIIESDDIEEMVFKSPFDISPGDFLEYANKDINAKYGHRYVNALANVKRALDCQLDTLLSATDYCLNLARLTA